MHIILDIKFRFTSGELDQYQSFKVPKNYYRDCRTKIIKANEM